MRPGRVRTWFCAATLIGFVLGCPALGRAQPASAADDWGLPQLMRTLAQVRSASARFTETKTAQILNSPLVASGTLTYVAPDHIEKITLFPVRERFLLDHNRVTIAGGPGEQTHVFALTADPRIAGLVEGIRATLAGDITALDRFYLVRLAGDAANWQLLLQPRDPALAHFVQSIRIQGSQGRIEAIYTATADGDHSEMTITNDVQDAG
jgi:hypothetical protein